MNGISNCGYVHHPWKDPSKSNQETLITVWGPQVSKDTGSVQKRKEVVLTTIQRWEILSNNAPNGSDLSMWTLQILPRPSTVYTGTASGGHYEPLKSPLTLLRSSDVSLAKLPWRVGYGDIPFEVKVGVRQGCVMSAVLFNLVIDWIMPRTTEDKVRGIRWTPFLLPRRTGLRCRFRLSVTLTQTRRFHRPIYF